MTYEGLMHAANRLLNPHGIFSLVIPSECQSTLEAEAILAGFFITRVCQIRTTPQKEPKRLLIEFSKIPVDKILIEEGVIEEAPNVRTHWYQQLTQDFYIR